MYDVHSYVEPVSAKRPVGTYTSRLSPRDTLIFTSCPTTPPSLSNAVIRSTTSHMLICSPSTGTGMDIMSGDTAGDGHIERKPSGNVMPRWDMERPPHWSRHPIPPRLSVHHFQPHVASSAVIRKICGRYAADIRRYTRCSSCLAPCLLPAVLRTA